MGSALASAFLDKKFGTVWAGNRSKPGGVLRAIVAGANKKFFRWTRDNKEATENADIIFIAVRPFSVQEVLAEIRSALRPDAILISITAGIHISKLKKWSGNHKKIVRIMPNLPVQILEGMSVWKATGLDRKEKQLVLKLINSFGSSLEINDEKLIDCPVSGVAPAYTAAFLESFINAARKTGYSKAQAGLIALQGVFGSLIYIKKTRPDLAKLISAVCTKGGVTEAGFKVLKAKKWQNILEKALLSGFKRAREISKTG